MDEYLSLWSHCPTCKQLYQSEILLPLANASVKSTQHLPMANPERMASSFLLGPALIANKDFVGAEHALLDVAGLANSIKVVIPSDVRIATQRFALQQLGHLYREKGDYSMSLTYFVSYRDTFDRQDAQYEYELAEADLMIQIVKHKMGFALDQDVDLESASQSVAAFRDRVNDSCDDHDLPVRANLALALAIEDRYEEAFVEFSETLRTSRRVLGPEHNFTKTLEGAHAELKNHLRHFTLLSIIGYILLLVACLAWIYYFLSWVS